VVYLTAPSIARLHSVEWLDVELKFWKPSEGSGRGLIEVVFRYLPVGTNASVGIVDIAAEIRTEHIRNSRQDPCLEGNHSVASSTCSLCRQLSSFPWEIFTYKNFLMLEFRLFLLDVIIGLWARETEPLVTEEYGFLASFHSSTADRLQDDQRYYEVYSVLLEVAMWGSHGGHGC
jgi:hypothetical protein